MKTIALALASVFLTAALAGCGSDSYTQPLLSRTVKFSTFNQVPSDYYQVAQGLQGQALRQALAGIVTKHKDLGYDRARDLMFGEVDDLDEDDVVECDYTDRRLEGVSDRISAYQGGKGFNAEHTWPQSKGAEGIAKSDLHHLFPTDCEANSKRSSFPFGEVVTVEWTDGGSKLGRNAKGVTVFEPRDDQKGNTARAILYFYTVYGQRVDLSNFRIEQEVLQKWHKEDPVTDSERARNDAVYRFQGNRNPFVDRPEFVQAMGTFTSSRNTPDFSLR